MKKFFRYLIGALLAVVTVSSLCSCDAQSGYILGQAAGSLVGNLLGVPTAGYRTQPAYVPAATAGNIDALLDPNLALAQTMQQVAAQEMQDYQIAKSLNPKLTLQEYRKQKREAEMELALVQAYDEQYSSATAVAYDNTSVGTTSATTGSTLATTVDHTCSLCHGSGRYQKDFNPPTFGTMDYKVRCNECGGYFMKSTGHSHIPCPQCHGKGHW
ncbi:MAG: hypothetical protein IJ160_11180 [Muribaculaceae bacterium]|nr:hypothetical protein [Muribaculaceae bacterium]